MKSTYEHIMDAVPQVTDEDELREINEAVVAQLKYVRSLAAQKVRAQIKIGDKVRITGGLRPKYLIGLTGEVTGRPTAARVPIKLGVEAGRYAGEARVPLSCIEKVEES